jgi:hypothetical protein
MAAIFDLVSVDYLTNAWVNWSDFFGGSLGGNWRKVPFNDCSSNMAAMAAILDLVSVDI